MPNITRRGSGALGPDPGDGIRGAKDAVYRRPWAVILAAAVLTAGFFRAAGAAPHRPGDLERAAQHQPLPSGAPAVIGTIARVEAEAGPDGDGGSTAFPQDPERPAVDDQRRSSPQPPATDGAPTWPDQPVSRGAAMPPDQAADHRPAPEASAGPTLPAPPRPDRGGGVPQPPAGGTDAAVQPALPGVSPPGAAGDSPPPGRRWRILIEAGPNAGPDGTSPWAAGPLPIWLTVDKDTRVGGEAAGRLWPLPPDRILQPGQRVRAWVRGGIRESYPAQGDAAVVVVEPYLRGTLEAREPASPADGGSGPSSAGVRLLVRGQALPPHALGPRGRLWVTVDQHSAVVTGRGRPISPDHLDAGTPLTVWIGGPIELSDPAQAYAPLVVAAP